MIAMLVFAAAIVGFLVGATFMRSKIASVFDRTFTCHACGCLTDRAISLSRCSGCREQYVGPTIGDEIRDDCFFES